MYERFTAKKAPDTKRVIWRQPVGAALKQRIAHLDLIPCDIDLIGEDLGGGSVTGTFPTLDLLRRQSLEYLRERSFLRRVINEVQDDYHYVLIDCPPNLYLMTQNALTAAHWYVVTAIPDHLSTIGLNILQRKVKKISKQVKSAENFAGRSSEMRVADIGGIVFVRVRLGGSIITRHHQNTIREVTQISKKGLCFPSHTTELIGYGEAAEQSLPVWMTRTENAGSSHTQARIRAHYERVRQ